MKIKLGNFFKIAFVLCGTLLLASSCTDDKYYVSEIIDNPIEIHFEPNLILKRDWKWNADKDRYEAKLPFNELTEHMFDDGVINASVFLVEDRDEKQTPLPYTRTWKNNGVKLSQILNFEIALADKSVTYFIYSLQDLNRNDYYLTDYEIKLSVTYFY